MTDIQKPAQYRLIESEYKEYKKYLPPQWHSILLSVQDGEYSVNIDVLRDKDNRIALEADTDHMYDIGKNEYLHLSLAALITIVTFVQQMSYGLNVFVILSACLCLFALAKLHIKDSYLTLEKYITAMARIKQLYTSVKLYDDDITFVELSGVVNTNVKIHRRYQDLIELVKRENATLLFKHAHNVKEKNL